MGVPFEDHTIPTRGENLLMDFKLNIFRFDPQKDEKPYYQTFSVQANPTDRLLDCLNRIRWEQDPTLAFRMSCAHGICGSDRPVGSQRRGLGVSNFVEVH